jgi:F-type H+-transporting ATPase subunit epsilon
MKLKVLLPYKVFAQIDKVKSIVAETSEGFFGILPQRLDCVAALVPGIFSYTTETDGEKYLAVDEGIIVKSGDEVVVTIHNAAGGTDLGKLHALVVKEFQHIDEGERNIRSVTAKLEAGFIHNLEKFHHG